MSNKKSQAKDYILESLKSQELINFNPDKPFYSFVLNYLNNIAGLVNTLHNNDNFKTIQELQMYNQDESINVEKSIFPYSNISLKSKKLSDINFNVKFFTTKWDDNLEQIMPNFQSFNAGILLITTYEITKDYQKNRSVENDPIWQFFRHCRNAVAHNKKFLFTNKNQGFKNKAIWRNFEITADLEGKLLFQDSPQSEGFLEPADVLYLLSDIEKEYPDIY